MKELLEGFFKKNNSKTIWPYFFVLAAGIILMLAAKYMAGVSSADTAQNEELHRLMPETAETNEDSRELSGYERALEKKLEEVLSEVQGVGRVRVLLTLSGNGQIELAEDAVYETTQTTGSGGDEKSLAEKKEIKHVLVTGKDGNMSPIVIKRMEPKIEGAVIVAEGGESAEIKASLTKAAGALLNLPAHKIEILKMNKQ